MTADPRCGRSLEHIGGSDVLDAGFGPAWVGAWWTVGHQGRHRLALALGYRPESHRHFLQNLQVGLRWRVSPGAAQRM